MGWIQTISAIFLCLVILLQEKGSGLGDAITGGQGSSFSTMETQKRGPERVIAIFTVFLACIFVVSSLLLNFI